MTRFRLLTDILLTIVLDLFYVVCSKRRLLSHNVKSGRMRGRSGLTENKNYQAGKSAPSARRERSVSSKESGNNISII